MYTHWPKTNGKTCRRSSFAGCGCVVSRETRQVSMLCDTSHCNLNMEQSSGETNLNKEVSRFASQNVRKMRSSIFPRYMMYSSIEATLSNSAPTNEAGAGHSFYPNAHFCQLFEMQSSSKWHYLFGKWRAIAASIPVCGRKSARSVWPWF